jgi:hypothetical protein
MAKSVYIAAILATLAIIFLILLSVKAVDDSRASQLNDELRQISLENQLQTAYEDFDKNNSDVYCLVVNQGINSLTKRANDLQIQLESYKDNAFNTEEFYLAKRNYLLTSMILFRNFEKAKQSCDLNMHTVLFFYAEDNSCTVECGVIGSQLNQLQKTCKSFRAFSFPYAWPSYDFTKILEVKYAVSKSPTLLIDGEKVEDHLTTGELSNKLGCQ